MRRLALIALALALAGCDGSPATDTLTIETAGGTVELAVELADSPGERSRGLMGRESLPERSGMLFLYEEDTRAAFWMKDTRIPLSIAFLDAGGRILAILDMEPCAADPCPVYDPGLAYRSALEVGRGAFARLGVAVGDVASLP
ncbi:MAG: DUF192 domain-containing protein [Thermoleophilia bacterium]|nr:DUF192 domain-containing protein [Thermoleophilia bacterium]